MSLKTSSIVVILFYSERFCFYEKITLCRNFTFVIIIIIYRSTGILQTHTHTHTHTHTYIYIYIYIYIYDRSHQNLTIPWANYAEKCSQSTVTVVKFCDFGLWQPCLKKSGTPLLKCCDVWYHKFYPSLRHNLMFDWNMRFLVCLNI